MKRVKAHGMICTAIHSPAAAQNRLGGLQSGHGKEPRRIAVSGRVGTALSSWKLRDAQSEGRACASESFGPSIRAVAAGRGATAYRAKASRRSLITVSEFLMSYWIRHSRRGRKSSCWCVLVGLFEPRSRRSSAEFHRHRRDETYF